MRDDSSGKRVRFGRRKTFICALIGILLMGMPPSRVSAADKVVTGIIIGFACGESASIILRDLTGNIHEGVCREDGCEQAAWEKRWCDTGTNAESVSRNYIGRKIKAKVSKTAINEHAYTDEFIDIAFIK